MSDPQNPTNTPPAQAPMQAQQVAPGGTPQQVGGVMRTTPGQNPQDVTQPGVQVAEPGGQQQQQTQPGQQQPPADQTQQQQQTTPQPTEAEKQQAALLADPKVGKYVKEFTDSGDLSPESMKQVAADLGIPEVMVQAYVQNAKAAAPASAAQQQIETQKVNFAQQRVGGADKWTDFAAWANTNLNEADMAALQDAVNGSDKSAAMSGAVIDAMYSRFAAASGTMPRDVTREGGAGDGIRNTGGYASRGDMLKDMNDRRYGRDADFTKQVEQRVALSNFA